MVIRGVERCLAEFCVVWATARLLETCAPPEVKRDFVFHLRPLLEHAPARDRHEVRVAVKVRLVDWLIGCLLSLCGMIIARVHCPQLA